jgi:hypothetical protein
VYTTPSKEIHPAVVCGSIKVSGGTRPPSSIELALRKLVDVSVKQTPVGEDAGKRQTTRCA